MFSIIFAFLLQEFADNGWTTAFLEDFAFWGLSRAGIRGFEKPPVDHYYRPTYIPLTKETGQRGEHMRNTLQKKAISLLNANAPYCVVIVTVLANVIAIAILIGVGIGIG